MSLAFIDRPLHLHSSYIREISEMKANFARSHYTSLAEFISISIFFFGEGKVLPIYPIRVGLSSK